jgi:hypothetical protein
MTTDSNFSVEKEVAIRHLLSYLDTRPGKLTIAFEPAYLYVAEALKAISRRSVQLLPASDITPDQLFSALTASEKFLCAFNRTFAAGFTPHVDVMIERSTSLSIKAFTLTDISADFFNVFQSDPKAILQLNERLMNRFRNGSKMLIRDTNGTHLQIDLQNDLYDWVSIDGFTEAALDLTFNLPPGEVATYSPSVNGEIYFVGGLLGTIPIGRKYGLIEDPIYITIQDGIAIDFNTDNKKLREDLEFCLNLTPFTNSVCEVGIGTNPSIRSLKGLNYTFEEKHYGFHLGFGATLAQQNNVERMTDHHLDLLFSECTIELDDQIIFDGEFHV